MKYFRNPWVTAAMIALYWSSKQGWFFGPEGLGPDWEHCWSCPDRSPVTVVASGTGDCLSGGPGTTQCSDSATFADGGDPLPATIAPDVGRITLRMESETRPGRHWNVSHWRRDLPAEEVVVEWSDGDPLPLPADASPPVVPPVIDAVMTPPRSPLPNPNVHIPVRQIPTRVPFPSPGKEGPMRWNGPRSTRRRPPDRAQEPRPDEIDVPCVWIMQPGGWAGPPGMTSPTVPTEPSMEWSPQPGPGQKGPPHEFKKPGPGEKEVKVALSIGRHTALGIAANFVTESCDVIKALYFAIPEDHRRFLRRHRRDQQTGERQRGCSDMAVDVYRHAFNIDWDQALQNLGNTLAIDFIYGSIGRTAGRAARALGRSGTGIQTGSCFRRPDALGTTGTWFDELMRKKVPPDHWWTPGWYEDTLVDELRLPPLPEEAFHSQMLPPGYDEIMRPAPEHHRWRSLDGDGPFEVFYPRLPPPDPVVVESYVGPIEGGMTDAQRRAAVRHLLQQRAQ